MQTDKADRKRCEWVYKKGPTQGERCTVKTKGDKLYCTKHLVLANREKVKKEPPALETAQMPSERSDNVNQPDVTLEDVYGTETAEEVIQISSPSDASGAAENDNDTKEAGPQPQPAASEDSYKSNVEQLYERIPGLSKSMKLEDKDCSWQEWHSRIEKHILGRIDQYVMLTGFGFVCGGIEKLAVGLLKWDVGGWAASMMNNQEVLAAVQVLQQKYAPNVAEMSPETRLVMAMGSSLYSLHAARTEIKRLAPRRTPEPVVTPSSSSPSAATATKFQPPGLVTSAQ